MMRLKRQVDLVKYDSRIDDAALPSTPVAISRSEENREGLSLHERERGFSAQYRRKCRRCGQFNSTSTGNRMPYAITERGDLGFGTITGRALVGSLSESFVLKPVPRP